MLTALVATIANLLALSPPREKFSCMISWLLDYGTSRHIIGCQDIWFNIIAIDLVPIGLPNGS